MEEEGDYKLDAIMELDGAQLLTGSRLDDDEEDFPNLQLDCLDDQTNREEVDEKLTTMYSFLVAKSSNKQEVEDKLLDELIHH